MIRDGLGGDLGEGCGYVTFGCHAVDYPFGGADVWGCLLFV